MYCKTCHGKGAGGLDTPPQRDCPDCNGSGYDIDAIHAAFMEGHVIRFNKPHREHRMWLEKDNRYRWSTRDGNDVDTGTGDVIEYHDPGIRSAIEIYIGGEWGVTVDATV